MWREEGKSGLRKSGSNHLGSVNAVGLKKENCWRMDSENSIFILCKLRFAIFISRVKVVE